MMGESHGLSTE
ncbi:Hypothetical protein SSCIU_02275 [Mammaliicoccus sciuri]|nr:Hypothetical protein SSCIU_02275 [Mammaliicoccus sciuri]